MRRLVCLALAGLLAWLPGCGGEGTHTAGGQTQQLRLCVDDSLDPEALEQAQQFAQQVEGLSKGDLTVEVFSSDPEGQEWDLAFLSCGQLAQENPVFSMFALPFLYDSGAHMSRALNAQSMLESLAQRLEGQRLRPLAAFYRGGAYLASSQLELRTPGDFQEVVLALGEDAPEQAAAFQALGAQVILCPPGLAPSLLGEQVDDPSGDPGQVEVQVVETTLLEAGNLAWEQDGLTLINSCHGISPLWLVVDEARYDQLTDFQRAVVLEALAGLSGRIEAAVHAREQEQLQNLAERGIAVVEVERPLLAQAVYERGSSYEVPEFFDRQLYERIQEYA